MPQQGTVRRPIVVEDDLGRHHVTCSACLTETAISRNVSRALRAHEDHRC